ncbi:MAG: formylglycine-generating enzyme family protein [Pseudomonadota bacterium]
MDPILISRLKRTCPMLFVFFFACSFFSILSLNNAWALDNTITNSIGMQFILVKPGSFMMGSPETEPFRDADELQHKMEIKTFFYLQATEVTIEQWETIMGKKMFARKKGGQTSPATRVSFFDCQNFIKKLNAKSKEKYRLPSEAEWEYACRSGSTTAYYWGNDIDCSKAMYGNNTKTSPECTLFYKSMNLKPDQAAPVKSFKPNPWGFYDMHGNVWEWCSDQYRPYMDQSTSHDYDTIKQLSRVRRGGSFYKHSKFLRSANRTYAHPGAQFQTTGFRLVLEAN